MPDTAIVQRFTPPSGCQLLSMEGSSDDQAGVKVRDIYKSFRPTRPEDLDFSMALNTIATLPDMLNWHVDQEIDDLPRISCARRKSDRFLLIVMGGGGSCLITEMLDEDKAPTSRSRVRVHPYPLHLPLNQSLRVNGISFGISAGNHAGESHITIGADPGVGPGGTALPSAPRNQPPPTSSEKEAILALLDQEILAWGEIFAASHKARLLGQAGWPADLCRHVLLDKELVPELTRVVRAVAIRAHEKFAPDSQDELVVGLAAPNRPSPLAGGDPLPWSAFVNLRNQITPDVMKDWIETTLRAILDAKRPDGWFEIIGPDMTSRLGVQSQLSKTFATIRGPFSNHQRMEVMGVLAAHH